MSRTGDRYQAERWLDTEADIFAHACCLAQQAAEKAAKSLWYAAGDDPWGHSVLKLIGRFPHRDRLPDLADWEQRAALLDRFYIPTRLPERVARSDSGPELFRHGCRAGHQDGRSFRECRRYLAARTG